MCRITYTTDCEVKAAMKRCLDDLELNGRRLSDSKCSNYAVILFLSELGYLPAEKQNEPIAALFNKN